MLHHSRSSHDSSALIYFISLLPELFSWYFGFAVCLSADDQPLLLIFSFEHGAFLSIQQENWLQRQPFLV